MCCVRKLVLDDISEREARTEGYVNYVAMHNGEGYRRNRTVKVSPGISADEVANTSAYGDGDL